MNSDNYRESPARMAPVQAALKSLPVTAFYLFFVVGIIWALPDRAWSLKTQALVAMSVFGIWRYAWQVLHVVRHWRYRSTVFPRLRAEAMSLEDKYPRRLYIMVPSYKEEHQVSELVFSALIREAQMVPSKVLIYASVGSDDEVEFISKVINSTPGGNEIETVFMHQEEGKRVAMGYALRAIARDFNDAVSWHPDAGNDVVIFMDGDTLVEPGMFGKTLPYFRANPELGALTTDNMGVSPDATSVFSDWYTVKFAQRNHVFYSHSLSRRVLTITGRFSLYRARLVVNEEFIRFLEADHLDHWLFGRFRFLMGDDKSTWYYLLKEGMEMLYVPDAMAVALEMRQKNFIRTSLSLMHRWYGNMLRSNWRAVKLGPKPMGFFIWWCVLDQRFSSFTPLVGPVSIILLSIFDSWFYLAFYAAWVILTRLTMMWVYVLEGMPLHMLHIPLVLYNQWVGAVVKIYSMYSLSTQTWQKSGEEMQETGDDDVGFGPVRVVVRTGLVTLSLSLLVILCGVVSGAFVLPGASEYAYYKTRWKHGELTSQVVWKVEIEGCGTAAGEIEDGAAGINSAIESLGEGECLEITLPEGRVVLDAPLLVNRDNISLRGAGKGRTILESRFGTVQGVAALMVGGEKGPVVGRMTGGANAGDKVISVDDWPGKARYAWLGAPNSDDFSDAIGDVHWRREKPWLRQFVAGVAGFGKGYVVLTDGLPMAFPAGTEVRAAKLVADVELSGFTLIQVVPDRSLSETQGVYENSAPDYSVDGIRFDWATDCLVEDVEIVGAGRHPLVFENSRRIRARRLLIADAWNKGKGGNGYVRFARSHECELAESEVRNVRHLAFQWGATNNVVRDCTLATDVNFHGGYSLDNRVLSCVIEPPPGHLWDRVTRMPDGGASWAPPDGPGNLVIP
ncbi:MAG: glycosyltransferase [Pseudodesulfovibrio sp.]|nr:glycosyltransferase [Pseudodesulfovibrio sp.]